MQSLQARVVEWRGVDSADVFQKLSLQAFVNLSTKFYTRVYDDEQEWFRSIFINSKKEYAIQNQYEFFVQRTRGRNLLSEKRLCAWQVFWYVSTEKIIKASHQVYLSIVAELGIGPYSMEKDNYEATLFCIINVQSETQVNEVFVALYHRVMFVLGGAYIMCILGEV